MWRYIYSGVSLQNRRTSNMDSILLKGREEAGLSALVAVVCDGVGSMCDGAFASGTAARELGKWFDALEGFECAGLKMRDAILKINASIVQEVKRRNISTASTMSAMLFVDGRYHIVHIGDSRIYACDGYTLSRMTNDDVSETGFLTAYIGQDSSIIPQYLEGEVGGRTFLICSDGLYKRMDDQYLAAHMKANSLRAAKNSIAQLTQYVIERGEKDNITTALIKTIS